MCAPCFAKTAAEVERTKKAKADAEYSAAYKYFQSGSARTALLANGVQPVNISWVADQKLKRGFLGFGERYVDVVTHGRGWILGEFPWQYLLGPTGYDKNGNPKHGGGNWLTALLDLPAYDEWSTRAKHGLARVHLISGGYEALGLSYYDKDWFDDWVEAVQAVKRLTGESS